MRRRLLILPPDEVPVVGRRQPGPTPRGGGGAAGGVVPAPGRRNADRPIRIDNPRSIVLSDRERPVGHAHRQQLAIRGDAQGQYRGGVLGGVGDLERVELKYLSNYRHAGKQ